MENFLKLLENNLIAVGVVFVIIVLGVVVLVSLLQGRKISFWPPRIGEKPIKRLSDNEPKVLFKKKSKYEKYYAKLFVHCSNCGKELLVANPRPYVMPINIHVGTSSAGRHGEYDYVRTGCPDCKHTQLIALRYREKE